MPWIRGRIERSATPRADVASMKQCSAWLSPSWVFLGKGQNTANPKLFRAKAVPPKAVPHRPWAPSHRRRQPVAADADAFASEGTVLLLFHEGDHVCTGLQF